MRRIDLRLAFAVSAALAVSVLVLVTINSTPPSPTSGGDPATGGQMLGTQAITTDELVRRVKAGRISTITVMGDHAVATTVDNDRFTFTVVRGASVLQQLQSLGVTPDELSQVDYVTRQPPLEGAPGELLLFAVPLVLFGAAALHVWRSSAPEVASQSQRVAQLREVRSRGESKRPAKSAARHLSRPEPAGGTRRAHPAPRGWRQRPALRSRAAASDSHTHELSQPCTHEHGPAHHPKRASNLDSRGRVRLATKHVGAHAFQAHAQRAAIAAMLCPTVGLAVRPEFARHTCRFSRRFGLTRMRMAYRSALAAGS